MIYDLTQMRSYKKPVFQNHIHLEEQLEEYPIPKQLKSLENYVLIMRMILYFMIIECFSWEVQSIQQEKVMICLNMYMIKV